MIKKRKVLLITATVLFLAGFITYYKLGGFNKPKLSVYMAPDYIIAGRHYKGKMNDKAFGHTFTEVEEAIGNKSLNGTLCGVFYNNPQNAKDSIDAFIGVIVPARTDKLPP